MLQTNKNCGIDKISVKNEIKITTKMNKLEEYDTNYIICSNNFLRVNGEIVGSVLNL